MLQKYNKISYHSNYQVLLCQKYDVQLCMLHTFRIGINLQNTVEASRILATMKHQAYRIAELKLVQQNSIHIIPQYNLPVK